MSLRNLKKRASVATHVLLTVLRQDDICNVETLLRHSFSLLLRETMSGWLRYAAATATVTTPSSIDKIKAACNTSWKERLRLCKSCVSLKVQPPTTNASMNFAENFSQEKTIKKQKRGKAVAVRLKKAK